MNKSGMVAALAVAALVVGLLPSPAVADLTVTVGPSTDPWVGYMNVFELPANGGGYVFGQPWGVPALSSSFDDGAPSVSLGATPLDDPTTDPFWYQNAPGGPGSTDGNKMMEAAMYQEYPAGTLSGETLTFTGEVLSNTLNDAPDRDTYIFIKDFAGDYSSSFSTIIPAPESGPFSISLLVDPGAEGNRHLQFGFMNVGPNVWSDTVAAQGSVVYGPIPEPATLALLSMGTLLVARRRR
ncbi:MAG: PEP-CTERM sorting domain-containing protein [Phycisphaerales bacterium]|nr:PEP-CTERM sorting domain-containing protein [Phycisphaerales bacterium]